jgi:cobalt-zinc-cadmium efflux system protein
MGLGHDHAHGGGHDHHHHAPPVDRIGAAFLIGILLNSVFVVAEFLAGFAADSMALMADAGHNLGDVLGLIVAWGGAVLTRRSAGPRFSYGLKKSSILAALINALLLLVAVGVIAAEAIRRLYQPSTSDGQMVMIVAGIGIVINGITALLFMRGAKDDINVRGAFLHMAADAAVSAGVVVAGFLTLKTGASWIDPLTSLIVAAVILYSTAGLLMESTLMTLAGVPRGIDPEAVHGALARLPGVTGAHHLHIWPLSTTETALTVHLEVAEETDRDQVLHRAHDFVHEMFGIDHSTIQVECRSAHGDEDCEAGGAHCHDAHLPADAGQK